MTPVAAKMGSSHFKLLGRTALRGTAFVRGQIVKFHSTSEEKIRGHCIPYLRLPLARAIVVDFPCLV